MSTTPAARCTGCGFAWNSPLMADGLRVLGSCPKCRGPLAFRDEAAPEAASGRAAPPAEVAPHLVLGLPRVDGGF